MDGPEGGRERQPDVERCSGKCNAKAVQRLDSAGHGRRPRAGGHGRTTGGGADQPPKGTDDRGASRPAGWQGENTAKEAGGN